jgi:hypothetical protein
LPGCRWIACTSIRPPNRFCAPSTWNRARNATDWRLVKQGAIERWSGERTVAIDIPDTRERYFRLRIYNRDDRPIGITGARLEGLIRTLKFIATERGDYHLVLRRHRCARPRLRPCCSVVAPEKRGRERMDSRRGGTEPVVSPARRAGETVERAASGILYTVLGAAVLGLGVATVRFAMRIRKPPRSIMARYFTLEEAEQKLPEVEQALREALLHKAEYQKASDQLEKDLDRIRTAGGSRVNPGPLLALRSTRDTSAVALKAALERIEEAGAMVKDLDIGLIDFLRKYRGQDVCLCWKLGEARSNSGTAWRRFSRAQADRRRIPQEPALVTQAILSPAC